MVAEFLAIALSDSIVRYSESENSAFITVTLASRPFG